MWILLCLVVWVLLAVVLYCACRVGGGADFHLGGR
jgi:hypothetical protein